MISKKESKQNQNLNITLKHGELRQAVLSALGLSILLGGTFLVTPNFPIIYATIVGLIQELTKKNIPPKKIIRVFRNLERNKIVYLEEKNGEVYVHLQSGFTPIILKYSL